MNDSHTPLGQGGEFDRIRAIWRRLGPQIAGAGDDCAFVDIGGARLAISTDLSVEAVHFNQGWLAPGEIGWRAAAAALSDLAAVAAVPLGVLASVSVPREWPEEHVTELMAGVADAAQSVGAVVWGGDLVAHDKVIVDVTVIGRLDQPPVKRNGAKAGDELWVTGTLGGPLAALTAWQAGREPEATARERFARPVPRISPSHWLRDHGATSMIDLSDGLLADAGHLAAASGVLAEIEEDRVPVHSGADRPADALTGGEEYELLVTMPTGAAHPTAFQMAFGIPLSRVGRIETGSGVRVVREGKVVKVEGMFGHFNEAGRRADGPAGG